MLRAQHALLCFLEEMTFVVSRRKMSYDNGMSEAAKEAAKTTSAELIEIDALGKNPQFAKSGFEPSGRL